MTPTQAPPSDAVVRKIQLLLNLGQRSEGNETEAAAAMAKAQELLAQYNLDLATVQDSVVPGGTAAREAATKRDYARISRSAMYRWQRELVKTIAEANFCVYWVEDTQETRWNRLCNVKRHKVLGRVVNTTGVLVMVDYLLETIERLLPWAGRERLCRDAVMWREGCADRIMERIREKAEAMRTADYATQGEAVYTTAIQVADLAKKEEAANHDHVYGAGAWARKLARTAKYDDAYWERIAQENEQKRLAAIASETPAQKKARERREEAEARRSERYWAGQDRKDAERDSRKRSSAYREGQAKGSEIGLDSQVGAGAARKELA